MSDKKVKVIRVNRSVFATNDRVVEEIREKMKSEKTFFVNVMASPGAGKSTTLLRTIAELKGEYKIGVMEADIDATVDAEKMQAAGVDSIQVHTEGECAMNAGMVKKSLESFPSEEYDLLLMENVGNLVCPAEEDTGSSMNLEILSYPEGDDKPLKYPLMFTICDAVIINKIDTREYFDFDDDAVVERIHALNPNCKIFFLSAKTGEGFDAWVSYLRERVKEWMD